MAKNSRIIREARIRKVASNQNSADKVAKNTARKQVSLKIKDKSLDMSERVKAMFDIQKLSRDGSETRQRNRCQNCGRPRGIRGALGLCRCCIYTLSRSGTTVFGLRKSSW